MIKEAIYHVNESEYSFPLDEHKLKVRLRVKKDDDILDVTLIWNVAFKIYKSQKRSKMEILHQDDLFSYYEAVIEDKIPAYSYVFKITLTNNEVYFYSESGLTNEYDFKLAHLDSFRYGFINKNDIIFENEKFKGNVFYQIFVERFLSADKNVNKDYVNREWGTTDLRSKLSKVYQDVFIGGDLEGVISKLDYIKDLGVDVIYLTPICQGNTNHKYDVVDYYHVDKMFGTDETLNRLVNLAHQKGLKIVLDLVFNHSSSFNEMFLDVAKNGRKSKYYDFYYVEGEKPRKDPLNYYCFMEVWGMPKLNSNNYKEQEFFVNVGKYFIEKYHVDGYRLDVANEVSHDFWINFKRELKKIDPNIILIGECWYNSHSYLRSNEFESVMNYPFLNASMDFFAKKKFNAKEYAERLNNLLMRYQDNSNRMMLNLLDSHDTERFYNLLAPNKDLYLCAVATLIMHVGWPMIYYGNEIFMKGGPDPFNRKGMEWESEEFKGKYHSLFKDILRLRKSKIIKEGEMKVYYQDSLFLIDRYIDDERITLVVNSSDVSIVYNTNEKEVILSNNYKDNILLPFSFLIYKTK